MTLRNWVGWMLCLMLILMGGILPGTAEELQVEDCSLDLGESRIVYPRLTGLEDQEREKALNGQIQADGDVIRYLTRMTELISSGSLRVNWTGGLFGEIFSCGILAEGAVETLRETSRWTCSNLDLADDHEIELGELWADQKEAPERLTEILETDVEPEMSPMLLNCRLSPLPETFRVDETGLTLLYPAEQLSHCGIGRGMFISPGVKYRNC